MVEWMQDLERRVRRREDSVSAVTLAVGGATERSRSGESRTRTAVWAGGGGGEESEELSFESCEGCERWEGVDFRLGWVGKRRSRDVRRVGEVGKGVDVD